MARLKISGNVRIGHIYECEFGLFKHTDGVSTTSNRDFACEDDYNYRIPNEIIKKRAVVVIGKHRGLYLVVPISSTKETDKKPHKNPEVTGLHTKLQAGDFPETHHYEVGKERWAKSNLVCSVDGGRLRDIFNRNTNGFIPAHKVSDETLKKVREGVLIA
ncbi:hypothetical protein HKB36_06810, partial [Vibrio parahaemolyticus]